METSAISIPRKIFDKRFGKKSINHVSEERETVFPGFVPANRIMFARYSKISIFCCIQTDIFIQVCLTKRCCLLNKL
jgi:hypothetical protein